MKIYVGNLRYSTTEDELDRLFSDFGSVESVSLIKDNFSGQSRGFGFIEIPKNCDADKAIKALNGSSFQGKLIKVNQAQARDIRSRQKRRRHY